MGTAPPLTPSWHAERTSRFARALRAQGVAEGDTIAILMENNRQYLEVAWAAQRSGLRYTAINSHLRPAQARYVLDDCRPTQPPPDRS